MASVLPKTDSPASSSAVPSAVAVIGPPPSDLDVLEDFFVFLVLDDLDSFVFVGSLFASREVLTTGSFDLDDLHC